MEQGVEQEMEQDIEEDTEEDMEEDMEPRYIGRTIVDGEEYDLILRPIKVISRIVIDEDDPDMESKMIEFLNQAHCEDVGQDGEPMTFVGPLESEPEERFTFTLPIKKDEEENVQKITE